MDVASQVNRFGQPVGEAIDGWGGAVAPSPVVLSGRFCRLEPLDAARHSDALFQANAACADDRDWTYLPYGPFGDAGEYRQWVAKVSVLPDPLFFAIVDVRDEHRAVGVASFLRIAVDAGSVEVGHIKFSPLLQARPAATEAMYLLMRHAFTLGFRRYEWKCDALNAASRRAAERLGFVYEGLFRRATVVKGRNRDTAWYSVVDTEWPRLETAFKAWLAEDNFATSGDQLRRLEALRGGQDERGTALD